MLNLVLPNEQARRFDSIPNSIQKLSCTEKQQPDSYNDPNQNQRRKVKERREDIHQHQLHAFTDFYMALGEEHRTHQRDKKRATQNTIRSSGPSTYQVKPLQSVKKPFALKVSRGFSMGA